MTDSTESSEPSAPQLQRLQRVLASAGIGSRRECELIILEGRVEVDGQIVATLGTKVDPTQQKIFVDGERIAAQRLEYYMLNKPPGVVSTSNDPSGRARVIDLIKTDQRVYNVGRLDQSSEGLILVTNDGELANKLTHPKFGIHKKYHVKVDGVPTNQQLKSLEEGIYIAEGKAKAESAKRLRGTESHSWLEIVLAEGKNREIRRILAKLGHKVRVLKRVAIGPLKLADLPTGAHRRLTAQEVKMLKRASDGLLPQSRGTGRPTKLQPRREPTGDSGFAPSKKLSARGSTAQRTKPFARKTGFQAGQGTSARGGKPKKPAVKQFSQVKKSEAPLTRKISERKSRPSQNSSRKAKPGARQSRKPRRG